MTYFDVLDGKRKIFSYGKQYNKFRDISEDDIERIKDKIKMLFGDKKHNFNEAIEFLAGKDIHFIFPSYDEKILFLILASDPDFLMHKIYLDSKIILESTINKANDEEKEALIKERKQQSNTFINRVKSKLGFFDNTFLTYESDLRKILEKDSLVFNVKYDALSKILERAEAVKNFDNLTDEDFKRLKTFGERWLIEAPNPNDYNSLAYNLLIKPELFSIRTIPEQVLQFILLFDPELRMLKIYEDETREDSIKSRCVEELGFYDSHLILLERKYHDRFVPNMKISIWDK